MLPNINRSSDSLPMSKLRGRWDDASGDDFRSFYDHSRSAGCQFSAETRRVDEFVEQSRRYDDAALDVAKQQREFGSR
ncbi:hypothetical protein [Mycobacterium asiaticum]|uniref:Uncharacterized protein n=1 Tax=Mycobacterium asiaticum TaxID=1790 RepID=A0A1A3NCY5_MYCAS|nr:hypothetical protein [Mycobacterium asiaticum]OBK19165.1 hypothetical protein A5636_19465 [Mycobacterium asiaticum]